MITIAHANNECTGSMLQVEMKPAEGPSEGSFNLCIVSQSEIGVTHQNGWRAPASFNGESSYININAKQTAHLLLVLEGKMDSINSGKGLFENGEGYVSILHCDRLKERPFGFSIHIITKMNGKTYNGRIIVNPTEALMLCRSMNAAMDRVAFGE